MDKAPAYGAGDSGFESQYGLNLFAVDCCFFFVFHPPVTIVLLFLAEW